MNKFSKREAISYGWETFKTRVWFFAGVTAITLSFDFIMNLINEFLLSSKTEQVFSAGVFGQQELWLIVSIAIIFFAQAFVQWWLYLGMIKISLNAYDKKELFVKQLFETDLTTVWRFVIATFLYWLIILGGFILLIVPGIIWSVKFQYYAYGIIDKKMGIIESLKHSAYITKGNKGNIFVFNIVTTLIMVAGFIAFYVGIVFTLPIAALSWVWVYRWLEYNSQPMVRKETTEIADFAKKA